MSNMDFYYRELCADNRRNQTILIAHGWLGMGEHWMKIGEFLADYGFHVLIPDLPNHGRSFHTEDFSYEEIAIFLHEFVNRKKVSEQPILIGHSMGGKIIMKMGDLFPNAYDRLVVIDILPISYPFLLQQGGVAEVILNTEIEKFTTRGELLSHFRNYIKDKGWLALIMQNVQCAVSDLDNKMILSWKSNAHMLAEKMDEVAGAVSLNEVKIPTLLIRGDSSDFTRECDLDIFEQKFTSSKIVTINSCGHWVMVDKTAIFLHQLALYLGID